MYEKETWSLSASFTIGLALWLIYGLAIRDRPLIGSNAVRLALMVPILAMKLRDGRSAACASFPALSAPAAER